MLYIELPPDLPEALDPGKSPQSFQSLVVPDLLPRPTMDGAC